MKFRFYVNHLDIFYSYLLHFFSGYLYAILILVVTTTQTFTLSQYFEHMFMVGMNLRTSLISAIYRKALRMTGKLDTVQDFLIKLGIKPHLHILKISIFSLNHVIIRPTKIMNNLLKVCKICTFKVIFRHQKSTESF